MVVTLYFVISQWLVNKYEAAAAASNSSNKDEVKLTDDSENSKAKDLQTGHP